MALRSKNPGGGPRAFSAQAKEMMRKYLEGAACEKACAVGGRNAAAVKRQAGLKPADPLTFRDLAKLTDFPARPAVTGEPPDTPFRTLTRFRKSALWAAWVAFLDEQPAEPPGGRVLVFRGPGWGLSVLAACDTAWPPRPHVALGHDVGCRLAVEPFAAWCGALRDWGAGTPVYAEDDE